MVRAVTKAHEEHGDTARASAVQGEVRVCQRRHASSPSRSVVGPGGPSREKPVMSVGKEDRIACGELAAKEEASQKKKRKEKNEKHTSRVAVYHFLPNPPKATSRGAPEVAVRKGGQRRTRKHERQRDSEVAVKKMLIKRD